MHFCLMAFVCVLIGSVGPVRAETPPTVWNETWDTLERDWKIEFDQTLGLLKAKRFAEARASLNGLTKLLAKMNIAAQASIEINERDTLKALSHILIDDSRRAVQHREIFTEGEQDLVMMVMSELVERAADSRGLWLTVKRDVWSQYRFAIGSKAIVGAASWVLTTGALDLFLYSMKFHRADFQTPTAITVGVLAGGLAAYLTPARWPRVMRRRPNLVAPVLKDCQKLLML